MSSCLILSTLNRSTLPRIVLIRAGWDGAYIDRFLADLKQVFKNYLVEIGRLAEARPDRSILVRPHPFESEEVYRAALVRHPNVVVDGTGSVLDMIQNAAAVIHLNCGTAIEAVLLGKLPIQLEYLNTPATAGHALLPARVSVRWGRKIRSAWPPTRPMS